MGESLRDRKASSLYNEISGFKPAIANRFDNYKSPYEMSNFGSNLDKIYGGYQDIINRDTAQNIANQQSKLASSMASRGITGGSILSNTQSKIASDINQTKANAIKNLGISKAGNMNDLMKYFNSLDLNKRQLATNVDLSNIGNLFRKFGLQSQNLGYLSDDTSFDDFLAFLNTGSNFIEPIGRLLKNK